MPFDPQTLARHFRGHIRDLICSVTIGATTASGSKGSIEIGRVVLEAGVSGEYAFSVWIDAVRFAAAPTIGSKITVDAVEYRVGGVVDYADGAGWRLDLVHVTQPKV